MFAFANTAEAVDLWINNPGSGSGSLEIWVNGILMDWKSFTGGESYLFSVLVENDLVEMKNEAPDASSIFSGYSENNFMMPATTKTVTATFDLNVAPTDITLSTSSVDENSSVGTVVGILSTTDPNPVDTHTYSIQTAGVPFQIGGAGGDELQVAGVLDYETQNSYSITIRTTDSGGLTYDEIFTITLNDVNDVVPVVDAAQSFAIDENLANGALVGTPLTARRCDRHRVSELDHHRRHRRYGLCPRRCHGPDHGARHQPAGL
jgi:hypothetical protein